VANQPSSRGNPSVPDGRQRYDGIDDQSQLGGIKLDMTDDKEPQIEEKQQVHYCVDE